jgi:hypothetical protein
MYLHQPHATRDGLVSSSNEDWWILHCPPWLDAGRFLGVSMGKLFDCSFIVAEVK